MRSLILAGVAAIISVGAHALLIFLIFNLDLGAAKATGDSDVTSAPILDDGKEAKKDVPEDKAKEDRGKEDEIDLSQTDIGNKSGQDLNYNVPNIGDISVPQLDPKAAANDTPGFNDPNITNTVLSNIPPPPGTGGPGTGGPLASDASGTAPMILGLNNGGGLGGIEGIKNPFLGRGAAVTRQRMLDEGGGNKESEAMVARGLQFLSNHQAPDGHWSMHEFDRHARKQIKKPNGEIAYVYERDKSAPGTARNRTPRATTTPPARRSACCRSSPPATRRIRSRTRSSITARTSRPA